MVRVMMILVMAAVRGAIVIMLVVPMAAALPAKPAFDHQQPEQPDQREAEGFELAGAVHQHARAEIEQFVQYRDQ